MQALDLIQSGKATSVKLKGIRNDLDKYGGSNDVTIYQGDEKYGLKHIERRHGKKCFKPVLEAVANGKIARYEDRNRTVAIQLNNYEAVLSLNQNGKNKTWLLTGYDIIEDYRKNKK